ncbi:MAG: Na+/H+ antiporter NhaA, partial [Alistipes sp.]|nr:Na+/H+ antiporter NhaA [Alistipes sp.]
QYSPEWGSVGMGIFFGLLVGKPLGIWLTSLLAVKCGIADRPEASTWKMLFAVACLGGIGFTMSIFVDSLAFDKQTHAEFIDKGKIAILMGSACAAIVGSLLIMIFSRAESKK